MLGTEGVKIHILIVEDDPEHLADAKVYFDSQSQSGGQLADAEVVYAAQFGHAIEHIRALADRKLYRHEKLLGVIASAREFGVGVMTMCQMQQIPCILIVPPDHWSTAMLKELKWPSAIKRGNERGTHWAVAWSRLHDIMRGEEAAPYCRRCHTHGRRPQHECRNYCQRCCTCHLHIWEHDRDADF